MSTDKRPIQADDLYRYELLTEPQISPDGRHVVFGVQRVERETEKKHTNLWLAAADGSRLRQFTYGKQSDSQPRWSPDGTHIAFLSNRGNEEQSQLYVIPVDGGEARPVTSLKGRIAAFEWSPDGTQFVCQFRQKDAAELEREKDEQKKKLGIPYRHITNLDYKFDGMGYLPQEKFHIWTVDAATGEATQLTEGDYNETEPHWTPDGKRIVFTSNRSEKPDLDWDAVEIYTIPAEGGEMTQVASRPGRKFAIALSPDGRHVAYIGRVETGRWYQNASLYVTPLDDGSAEATRQVDAGFDLHLAGATTGDFSNLPVVPPVWSPDGQTLYALFTRHGKQGIAAFAAFSDEPQTKMVIDEPGVLSSFSLDDAGERLAYGWTTLDDPGQVMVREVGDADSARVISNLNTSLLAELETGQLEEVWFEAADGYKLHGWILKPPGFDPDKQYPSILQIHGGPQMQYGYLYSHEFAYLAAHGYVVYWSNPRGGQGYGQEHAKAIYGQWGSVDYDDVMAWADYMAAQPYIDTERMGVTGGSYGGYMTTLIIGRTNRFKAAVAQRVVSNFTSFYGSSDLSWGLENLAGAPAPWDDINHCWGQSPISQIGNATTPTLVIHSEMDQRCDREQGEQVFVALRRLGVDTELLLLPGESHGLSRGGRTDRRIARLEHMVGWFERYLK